MDKLDSAVLPGERKDCEEQFALLRISLQQLMCGEVCSACSRPHVLISELRRL